VGSSSTTTRTPRTGPWPQANRVRRHQVALLGIEHEDKPHQDGHEPGVKPLRVIFGKLRDPRLRGDRRAIPPPRPLRRPTDTSSEVITRKSGAEPNHPTALGRFFNTMSAVRHD
jgi:hypothetical protein